MRFQLILFSLLISKLSLGSDQKTILDLAHKYDQIYDGHKVELIEEVFTKRYIKDSGGKEAMKKKISSLPKKKDKDIQMPKVSFKKGAMSDMYFVKAAPSEDKLKNIHTELIIIKEDGKYKIDGQLGDAD